MNHEKFLKYSSFFFILGGFLLLFGPRNIFPSFYNPTFLGIFFLLSPFLASIPILVFKKTHVSEHSISRIRSAIAFSLLINNAGELGLFKMNEIGFEYDKFAHFLICMLFAYLLGEYLTLYRKLSFRSVVMAVMMIVSLSGLLWEFLEASSDIIFHTAEWGVYGQAVFSDTLRDIFFNGAGTLSGIIVLSLPKKFPQFSSTKQA